MKKKMIISALAFIVLTALFTIIYRYYDVSACLSAAITFGTISYHFVMRLLVGCAFNVTMKNNADYTRSWFCEKEWEKKLYDKLHVKKWKNKMPTFDVSLFDSNTHSAEGIVGAMCQAELVHETIIVLSFVPILFGIRFGAYAVFIITSILAAMLDLCFVIMQRYNRPRLIKLMNRQRERSVNINR